jgi:dUTP pyrophosphatase
MVVKFKALSKLALLPKKATQGAAAYDLYIPKSVVINRGRQIVPLDFGIEIPYGYEAKIEPRSGFSSKGMEGASVLSTFDGETVGRFNCDVIQGKIDSDYRGCLGVIINNQDEEFIIPRGTRIAQLTFYKVEDIEFEEVEELTQTERGNGGFGSSGK